MITLFEDVIIQTVCRLLMPPMQLFALYVIAHGHHSPGGGFQGGVILGASFVLLSVAYSIEDVKTRMSRKLNVIFCSLGVIIFAGIGLVCLILGANYLDYGVLHKLLATSIPMARALGILGVEIGIGVSVMAVMISIYLNVASEGKYEDAGR